MILGEEYFDSRKPAVADIKAKYSEFLDLNRYRGLTHRDVVEATQETSRCYNKGLIIPRTYDFWDRSQTYQLRHTRRDVVPLDTPERFMKFGPEVNINKSTMSMKQAKETNFQLVSAMKEASYSMDVETAYRGFGLWGVKSKNHFLLPFIVLAEGEHYYLLNADRIRVIHQDFDTKQVLPSASRELRHIIHLRPLPTTSEFNVEATETKGDCPCEDRLFKEGISRMKQNDGFLDIYKYSKGEYLDCKHKYAAFRKAQELAKKEGKPDIRIDRYPKPTGYYLNSWVLLKTKTLVAEEGGKNARRPLKTEINLELGRLIASDQNKMFNW